MVLSFPLRSIKKNNNKKQNIEIKILIIYGSVGYMKCLK